MIKSAALVFLLLVGLFPVSADELWNRAVDIYEANSDLVPGRIEVSITEYGGRNRRVRNEEQGVYVTEPGPGSEPEVEIVRVIRNGDDITEERREDNGGGGLSAIFGSPDDSDFPSDESDNGNGGGPGDSNPFDPSLQNLVTYSRSGETRFIDGRRTIAFAFRQQSEDDPDQFITGTAWLDERSGAPLLIESTLDPLPSRLLNEFSIRSHFSENDDRWVLTRIDVDVAARVLLIRREFETSVTFSEHFRNPE